MPAASYISQAFGWDAVYAFCAACYFAAAVLYYQWGSADQIFGEKRIVR